jgi:branched-chain amino acid transport system permease protein
VTMADIATVEAPARAPRRFSLRPGLGWPVGLFIAAAVFFLYNYIDKYFNNMVPAPLHAFTAQWLPMIKINEALVYVLAALGLNVVVGYAGLLDLGFVAFWAIGGYTAGWLMTDKINGVTFHFLTSKFTDDHKIVGVHISWWIVLVAAALVCALAGVLIGAPTLRLRSDYLALVTLGFGEIIPEAFYNGNNIFGHNLTNGTQGMGPVDAVRFLTFDRTGKLVWGDLDTFADIPRFFIFCGLVALVMFASLRLRDGKLGRAWLAIREDELAASAMGVPLMRTKLSAYGIGAVAGGIAGAAFAAHVSFVLPDRFRFDISITLLAMVVLGGMGNVWGVTIGALILAWTNSTALPNIQAGIDSSGSSTQVGTTLLVLGLLSVGAGVLWLVTQRRGLIFVYLGVLVGAGGILLLTKGPSLSFQFFVFGGVLVIMMLFRREGFIPEARTKLVLREPGRTEAEALGADMEDVAPELEALPDTVVHAGGASPPGPAAPIDRIVP